jgi:predicted acyl esterase
MRPAGNTTRLAVSKAQRCWAYPRPGREPPDVYMYDPLAPVPSLGGASCCSALTSRMGPADQAAVEASNDVLVYTSLPSQRAKTLAGEPIVYLVAATSGEDTEFVARTQLKVPRQPAKEFEEF